jgi:hypothetical protein
MGLGTIIEALRLRSAAKKYAARLELRLMRDYGAAETYDEAQIRTAVRHLKLPERYISIGFAAFMTEDQFAKLHGVPGDYGALRKLYRIFVHHQPSSESAEAGGYYESRAGTRGSY